MDAMEDAMDAMIQIDKVIAFIASFFIAFIAVENDSFFSQYSNSPAMPQATIINIGLALYFRVPIKATRKMMILTINE